MTAREELIGVWTALQVTVAQMHETVDLIRRCMGFIRHSEPKTEAERASIANAARSLAVRTRTALAWGADDEAHAALTRDCHEQIRRAALVIDQHRRAINFRINGLSVVHGGRQ